MDDASVRKSILLLEDDPNLGLVIQDNLEMRGYDVVLCADGVLGLTEFSRRQFDLCLVDIMLPKKDGFTVVREIRAAGSAVPVIFLTARALKKDRIEGFEIGADDYVTKPFSMEELLLRIRAVLRRTSGPGEPAPAGTVFTLGAITFDAGNQLLTHADAAQKLTTKESDLLRLLCLHRNALLTREDALTSVWGSDSYFSSRSMDVYISKLRTYLRSDPSIEIVTVHGKGFKLIVPAP